MYNKFENVVFLGSDLKLKVSVTDAEKPMNEYNYTIELWSNQSKKVTYSKDDINHIILIDGEDNYCIVVLNTEDVGVGRLKCKVTIFVDDEDFPDDIRTEIVVLDTKINIIK